MATQKVVEHRKHQPLAYLGVQFSEMQENWMTYRKEAFAMGLFLERMDKVLRGPSTVRMYTDHRNLLFFFAPLALHPSSRRYVLAKLHRCSIHISRPVFIIEHILAQNMCSLIRSRGGCKSTECKRLDKDALRCWIN